MFYVRLHTISEIMKNIHVFKKTKQVKQMFSVSLHTVSEMKKKTKKTKEAKLRSIHLCLLNTSGQLTLLHIL